MNDPINFIDPLGLETYWGPERGKPAYVPDPCKVARDSMSHWEIFEYEKRTGRAVPTTDRTRWWNDPGDPTRYWEGHLLQNAGEVRRHPAADAILEILAGLGNRSLQNN